MFFLASLPEVGSSASACAFQLRPGIRDVQSARFTMLKGMRCRHVGFS
jgi:hypothetical protein